MLTCAYLCRVVGEQPEQVTRLHLSTQRRTKAFAIAIHVPVVLWAVTGYVIASRIFRADAVAAMSISVLCAGLIYMVERIVLATPKTWYVNGLRVLMGFVIAVLGASTVDLVVFEREVEHQLSEEGLLRVGHEYKELIDAQTQLVAQSRADWLKAQEDANCEANGTCGSRIRNVGPVYRQLARQAEFLRSEHLAAQSKLDELARAKSVALEEWRAASSDTKKAGLLTRIEALHHYTMSNRAAFMAWVLFFALLLFLELMVVLVKLVFGETVDDRIEMIREQISYRKAADYMAALSSPLARARELLDTTNG